jgi:hypothetical protein
MNILFSILSIVYISAIFILAGSPIVRTLASFNPYSLLHIPLYGVLTVLLIFSFVPLKFKLLNSINPRNSTNATNPINLSRLSRSESVRGEMRSLFHWDAINSTNSSNLNARFLFVGIIVLVVAIADEIHQAYVPGRDASITDVLLDLVGIILVLFFFFRLLKTKPSLIH